MIGTTHWVRIDREGPVHVVRRFGAGVMVLECGVTHLGAAAVAPVDRRGKCADCATAVEGQS